MASSCDFLVIGSGLAGLSFALKASRYGKVVVLTKDKTISGSTGRAQGGIASVTSPTDSLGKHVEDTLKAGAGLCRKDRVELLVSEGPEAVRQLIDWGVRFSKRSKGESVLGGPEYHLVKEGGHSEFRILHSEDFTGREILRALLKAVEENPNVEIRENVMGIDLLTNRHLLTNRNLKTPPPAEPACYGAYALDMGSLKVETYTAPATLLCTGGIGQLYSQTTNDAVSTGDGIAMAYRAGAPVEDMEFIQFHPTSFYDPGYPTFLISEALRGHGGVLVNRKGDLLLKGLHPDADLAPRDVVARAIDAEMKRTGDPCVFLDMRRFSEAELKSQFPNIFEHCLTRGLNMARKRIPVVPAAHFICGGVQVDVHSQTNLKGLYACGETASTGVHGANRLASNSLLEAVVFSNRALIHILENPRARPDPKAVRIWDETQVKPATEFSMYSSALETLRSTMWNYVGIVRNNVRLDRARDLVQVIHQQVIRDYGAYTLEPRLTELRNLALNAELIVRSAQVRRESRGLHYNSDYPESGGEPRHTVLQKGTS